MSLSKELVWRGFVNQMTFDDITELDDEERTLYFGVDPSAASMTIGNLAAAMMVRHFIGHGYKAYLLVGGATGMIGDPDGKSRERDLKNLEEIENNKRGIASEYKKVFDGMDFTLVDNYDWFKDINYLEFLREVGKSMSMTQMLDREFVQSRVGEGGAGISYAEFSYSLIQGYDYLHLHREHGVTLQVSGADQWGNSLAGVELIRKLEGATAHVYTVPLVINQATGRKFGKSEGGAVWLDPELTSPFEFYQFWLNVDDQGAGDYIKIYTLIEPDEFDALMNEFNANPSGRAAQKYLAYEATKIVHGEDAAKEVREASQLLAELITGEVRFTKLNPEQQRLLAQVKSSTEKQYLSDTLVFAELAKSKSEARRFIEQGAITVNDDKVDQDCPMDTFEAVNGRLFLKRGKNSFVLIKR